MKKTQYSKIKNKILKSGYVSRNWCLKNYISRLSAFIYDLREEGFTFETKRKNGDYYYYLVK